MVCFNGKLRLKYCAIWRHNIHQSVLHQSATCSRQDGCLIITFFSWSYFGWIFSWVTWLFAGDTRPRPCVHCHEPSRSIITTWAFVQGQIEPVHLLLSPPEKRKESEKTYCASSRNAVSVSITKHCTSQRRRLFLSVKKIHTHTQSSSLIPFPTMSNTHVYTHTVRVVQKPDQVVIPVGNWTAFS